MRNLNQVKKMEVSQKKTQNRKLQKSQSKTWFVCFKRTNGNQGEISEDGWRGSQLEQTDQDGRPEMGSRRRGRG